MDSISTKYFGQSDSMVCAVDATCSFALLLWIQALGALIGIMGAISYAPLMVTRQFAGKQFVPATGELEQLEFSYEIMKAKEID